MVVEEVELAACFVVIEQREDCCKFDCVAIVEFEVLKKTSSIAGTCFGSGCSCCFAITHLDLA